MPSLKSATGCEEKERKEIKHMYLYSCICLSCLAEEGKANQQR